MPQRNAAIEQMRTMHEAMERDAMVSRHAPAEMQRATIAMHSALDAWNTLQDPALVDHLAYVAAQRIAIAHAVARQRALEPGR